MTLQWQNVFPQKIYSSISLLDTNVLLIGSGFAGLIFIQGWPSAGIAGRQHQIVDGYFLRTGCKRR